MVINVKMVENNEVCNHVHRFQPLFDGCWNQEAKISTLENKFSTFDTVIDKQFLEDVDEDLFEKIVEKVECYFSDSSISRNIFLRKHLKGNKNGFVSLKLITSFKEIKKLTKDWRLVGEAIERKSKCLRLNDTKTKVCRIIALPKLQEMTVDPTRTVIAFDLPSDRPTIEDVRTLFSVYGDITFIRILRPGNPIPTDISKVINQFPDIKSKVSALVEYELKLSELKVVNEFNNVRPDFVSNEMTSEKSCRHRK